MTAREYRVTSCRYARRSPSNPHKYLPDRYTGALADENNVVVWECVHLHKTRNAAEECAQKQVHP